MEYFYVNQETKGLLIQFEIIINVLVIHPLHLNTYVMAAGIDFRRHVRIWRL